MADRLYSPKDLLIAAARDEPDQFKATRRMGRLAAALTAGGVAAGAALGGCVEDDELGAFGGVKDIPQGLWEQQQWAGQAAQPTAVAGTPLLRLNLPLVYARDWTIQLATPGVPSGAAVGAPSTFQGIIRLAWGHHGSVDQVLFSWPERGGTITVHGCFLELAVIDPTVAGARTANYNAWLTEGSGSRQSPYAFQPVFTHNVGTLGAAALSGFIPLQPRVRAFYITAIPNVITNGLNVFLLDNGTTRALVQIRFPPDSPNSLMDMLQEPFQVPPWVNGINIENVSEDDVDAVLVHQLLDLGG